MKKPYYDNSNLCPECTGSGLMLGFYPCKVCGATGVTRWPQSLAMNTFQPPAIGHFYAEKFFNNGPYYMRKYTITPHKLRTA